MSTSILVISPIDPVLMRFSHNGIDYKIKIKVNTENRNDSTAKLINAQEAVYKIAKESITWKGFEAIKPSNTPKFLRKNISSINLQLTENSGSFEITISLAGKVGSTLDLAQKGILSIKTPGDLEKYPWIDGLKKQQELLDKEFNDHELWLEHFKGAGAKEGKKRMRELLDDVLLNGQKTTVILGEQDSGEGLFLQRYVKNLLNHFCLGSRLPFFANFRNIENPENQLMLHVLKLYGLEQHENILKNQPTVFFLSDFHELFRDNEKSLFNIYESNDLGKQWPNALFVFTCRAKILLAGQENFCFAPKKKTTKLFEVSPISESDLHKLLK